MKPLDVKAALSRSPVLYIRKETTPAEADAAFPMLSQFNTGGVFVGRFQGTPPWELHAQDELLHVLDGEVEVTVLTPLGGEVIILKKGDFFVVPKGQWHRPIAPKVATLMSATPQPTEVSFAADPRLGK